KSCVWLAKQEAGPTKRCNRWTVLSYTMMIAANGSTIGGRGAIAHQSTSRVKGAAKSPHIRQTSFTASSACSYVRRNLPMPRPRAPRLSAPYLRRVVLDEARIEDRTAFPFSLPIFQKGFDLEFDRVV